MGDEKRKPGRPRKWASDAERMRAARAAKRENRLAVAARGLEQREAHDRSVSSSSTIHSETESRTNERPPSADHAGCDATIGALRTELVDLEERYDDLVLSRWILAQKYERALDRMRSHDPAGIAWLVEHLVDWEREVEAKRTKRLQEPNRDRVRRRYEEEFDRRLELARRASKQ